jgi:hypothetical protein
MAMPSDPSYVPSAILTKMGLLMLWSGVATMMTAELVVGPSISYYSTRAGVSKPTPRFQIPKEASGLSQRQ